MAMSDCLVMDLAAHSGSAMGGARLQGYIEDSPLLYSQGLVIRQPQSNHLALRVKGV